MTRAKRQNTDGTGQRTVGESGKYFLLAIFTAVASGPMLALTIHQVCVTKCLLLKSLPKVGKNVDDLILIVLFLFYVMLNFITCCIVWSLLCKAGTAFSETWLSYPMFRFNFPTLLDPKITRSGRPYGFRKARYVTSENAVRRGKPKANNR